MTKLTWDDTGKRVYETGVDHGVLYIPNGAGVYNTGFAWNGLVSVTESPSGAEANPQYADNVKYLNLVSAESFGATVEAFTYPDEFGQCDGTAAPQPGVLVGQQARKTFGLAYRTQVGNDLLGSDAGYKIHLIYGAQAAPSEKAYTTINDSPEALTFSWDITTTPVAVTGLKPTASITIDSTKVGATPLAALELLLYGTTGVAPQLPTPDAVVAIFAAALTLATPVAPTYVNGTHTLTIPAVTGLTYYINDVVTVAGSYVITEDKVVSCTVNAGYKLPAVTDTDWFIDYV
jgi:hypothetical protein